MIDEIFEYAALRNILKLHDLAVISSPWLKKTLKMSEFKMLLKLYDLDAVPSLWLKKFLKMGTSKCPKNNAILLRLFHND